MEMTVGTSIKRLRGAKGVTQEQLAELMKDPAYAAVLNKYR